MRALRLAWRNAGRNPRRSALTVAAPIPRAPPKTIAFFRAMLCSHFYSPQRAQFVNVTMRSSVISCTA